MISDSQLMVMDMTTRRRIADFHAEAEQHRMESLARTPTKHRDPWTGVAVVVLVLGLALLVASLTTLVA